MRISGHRFSILLKLKLLFNKTKLILSFKRVYLIKNYCLYWYILYLIQSHWNHIETVKRRSHWAGYFFLIIYDRDRFTNREQSETNRNDENAMCDYLSEYLRMCF